MEYVVRFWSRGEMKQTIHPIPPTEFSVILQVDVRLCVC